MPSRARWCHLAALLLGAACRHRYTWPTPPPLTLHRPAPPLVATRCERSAEPAAPGAHTPAPVAEGALSLVDLRGDDRLAVAEGFAVAWSPDGERLYTATRAAVLVWGARSGALEATWPLGAPMDSVRRVVVSPDGASIGVAGVHRPRGSSADAPVMWLLRTGEHPLATAFPGVGGALHLTADGRRLVTHGHAWDLATGEHRATPTPAGTTLWLPDGLRAVVITSQQTGPRTLYTPALWDAATGRELHRFPSAEIPDAVALSADGERVAVLHDGLDVFSTRTFERVARLTDVPSVGLVSLSRDGHLAVVGTLLCASLLSSSSTEARCPPPTLTLWDVDRATRLARTDRGAGSHWNFTGDDRFLTGPDTRLVDELLRVDGLAPVSFGERVRSVSPDGRFVLYERGPSLAVAALDGASLPSFERPARVIARSPDGAFSAALDDDGLLRIEGPDSCVRLAMASGHYGRLPPGTEAIDPTRDQLAFSADGSTLVALTYVDSGRPRVRALDSRSGAARWSMHATAPSSAAAYLSAGSVLVQGRGRAQVLRYDATTGDLLGTGRAPRLSYTTPPLGGATYEVRDHDGDRVSELTWATATRDGSVVGNMGHFDNAVWFSRWDLHHPERVLDVRVGDLIGRIALSPDEQRWAVGLRSGAVQLFATGSDRPVAVDAGHHAPLTALAFSASGDTLFTASEDGTLTVTHASTGRVLGRATFPFDRVTSLWVSPDGAELRAETQRGMRARFAVSPR
ncbi:MAG: WD40 repeat domain-containing protein [Deltaproteobacteria bacterium]|nr:WD40 repeat domain-containing protein [Myxococcales bacterium]MDP3218665.1 WD40 repeat domain-containing protein [Deltaproteobacteria bacterium]